MNVKVIFLILSSVIYANVVGAQGFAGFLMITGHIMIIVLNGGI